MICSMPYRRKIKHEIPLIRLSNSWTYILITLSLLTLVVLAVVLSYFY